LFLLRGEHAAALSGLLFVSVVLVVVLFLVVIVKLLGALFNHLVGGQHLNWQAGCRFDRASLKELGAS
jgi:hypothetical protein